MSNTLMNTLDADRRRAIENIREAANRIWARPLHRYFTDHTVAHTERIIALMDGLAAGMMTTDKRLSPTEVLVLLSAAYLHDIGMQNEKFAEGDLDEIRAHHNEQTAEMIYRVFEDPANAFAIPLGRDPGLVEAVALVAKGHRGVKLEGGEYTSIVYGGETLRLRLLAALLRFGDELDIDHRRVDLELMKLLKLPEDSQLHWWKCHYVSGVSIVDEYIKIAYRLPQDRPDYESLIVPLVETEIRAKLVSLEEIFRANAVKVAIAKSEVRPMRLVQPMPLEVEVLAKQNTNATTKQTRTLTLSQSSVEQVQIEFEADLLGSDWHVQEDLVAALGVWLRNVGNKPTRVLDVPFSNTVVVDMPTDLASRLQELAERRDMRLKNAGIVSVKFQEGLPIPLVEDVARDATTVLARVDQVLANLEGKRIKAQGESRRNQYFVRKHQEHYWLHYISIGAAEVWEKQGRGQPQPLKEEDEFILFQAKRGEPYNVDDKEVVLDVGNDAASKADKPTTLFDQRGQRVEKQINVAGDYIDQRQPNIIILSQEEELDEAGLSPAQTGKVSVSAVESPLSLVTDQQVIAIPHTPPDLRKQAAQIHIPLYLSNNSNEMARYIQIEMQVEAVFLAYDYAVPPFELNSTPEWKIPPPSISGQVVRCLFGGGADLVCHANRQRKIADIVLLVPYGAADGVPVPINISYDIAAERLTGRGKLTIELRAES